MKKRLLLSRSLSVGIILLFIGVAVAPSINFIVVKASQDDDLVEVTKDDYNQSVQTLNKIIDLIQCEA
jgi:hypothetical protein